MMSRIANEWLTEGQRETSESAISMNINKKKVTINDQNLMFGV